MLCGCCIQARGEMPLRMKITVPVFPNQGSVRYCEMNEWLIKYAFWDPWKVPNAPYHRNFCPWKVPNAPWNITGILSSSWQYWSKLCASSTVPMLSFCQFVFKVTFCCCVAVVICCCSLEYKKSFNVFLHGKRLGNTILFFAIRMHFVSDLLWHVSWG
jgi:hypothetical protein